jgi:hypothetical protein
VTQSIDDGKKSDAEEDDSSTDQDKGPEMIIQVTANQHFLEETWPVVFF